MSDRIQFRRDTAERWAQFNPFLLEGEIGIVLDNPNQYKVGDGVHYWNDLPLRGFNGNIVNQKGQSEESVMSQKAVTDAIDSNTSYLYCTSNAGDNKVVQNTGFDINNGIRLLIKMQYANTKASDVTLQVGTTDAKPIIYNGTAVTDENTWDANDVLDVYYDGNNYQACLYSSAQFATGEKVKNVGIDNEPTAGSDNLVKSGGVEKNLKKIEDSILGSYNCDTAANVAIKVITEQVDLLVGAKFMLTFNRGVSVYENVKLKVNGQDDADAKPLYLNGSPISTTNIWIINDVVDVYFDGNIYYAIPHIVGYDSVPTTGSKKGILSGAVYAGIESGDILTMAQSNKNKFKIDGMVDFSYPTTNTGVYIAVPLALDAGAYIITMEATGGSANVSLHDENKNVIKSYSAAFPYRFSLNSANSCLYIKIEAGATATSIKLSFKLVASEYKPVPYLVEGLYTVNNANPSNPKWSNNLSTRHYTIPVIPGDTLRGKGNVVAVFAFFVASQITTPTGGAAIPQISQFKFPASAEESTTVPNGATYAILDGLPAYLYVNGVNVVNDVIQALINSVSGGDGFAFQGIATPSTSISIPKSKAFYLGADGTYTNFGGSLTVPVGSIGVFTYNSGSWSLSTITIKQPLDIPAGWQPYVDNAITYVQANNLLSGQNGDSFVFVTDSHYPDNWGNSVKIAAAVTKKTNNRIFIHGGDFITKNQTRATFFGVLCDYASQLKALYGTAWRVLFGNHDDNTQDSGGSQSELVTDNEFYAVAMKGFENEVVNPNRNLYYYWDNVNQNIRYVCFNFGVGGAIDAQLSWFNSIVRNAPSNSHICIVIHGMWGSGSEDFMTQEGHLADMCDAINTRGTYTIGGNTYDYTSITPKVSVILCGHIHSFKQTYYGTSQIPVIALESDYYTGTNPANIKFSQKVHFIDLDFTNGKMYIFTLGYNINDSQGRDNKAPIDIVV